MAKRRKSVKRVKTISRHHRRGLMLDQKSLYLMFGAIFLILIVLMASVR
ncbi:hypothetical protein HY338_00645 [Candidatus Gottesmanbacteria bacterium]|nr:hypothetical protein [Candidatus Gottesmanbacteria bacterium]